MLMAKGWTVKMTMPEYIKLDDAMAAVHREIGANTSVAQMYMLKRIAIDLKARATSNVRDVIRAHWIEEDGVQTCSNCGEEHEWDEYRASYCDCCGAEMNGEDDNG